MTGEPHPADEPLRPAIPLRYAEGDCPAPKRRSWAEWAAITVVLTFFGSLVLTIVLPVGHNREPGNRAKCSSNLRQIAFACVMYANSNGGRFPDTLNDVLLTQDITSEVFVCPETSHTRATGATTEAVAADLTAGGHLSYVYAGRGLTTGANDATVVLLYEPLSNHRTGMNVVFADAHVEFHDATGANKILAELASGHNPPRPEKLK